MPHPVLLRAPRELDPALATRAVGTSGAPAILQRADHDFIEATLQSLRSADGRQALAHDVASTRADGVLKLFQPVQRQFHVAVMEVCCDVPGQPRVDPARVEAAGMVLRRIDPATRAREGWMRAGGVLRGWVAVGDEAERDARHDPSPARRLARKAIGPPALARELAAYAAERPGALLAEHVIPLFVAPPDVCAEAGRTLYYGLVPTTSSELAEVPAEGPQGFGPSSQAFREHLVAPLRGDAMTLPRAGELVSIGWRDEADIPPGSAGHVPALTKFVQALRQLAIEFDAFGDSAASAALFAQLQTIAMPLVPRAGEITARTVAAGTFLRACVPVLLERDPVAPRPEMPQSWPALGADAAARLSNTLSAALTERFKTVQGRAGRFDRAGARYQLRAFVRLKPECGCPSRVVWSDYSEPFTIAAWYEASGAAPVQVPLPDATDRNLLKSLKPNIAFVVPAALNNMLSGDAKKLAEGEGEASGSPALQWICSFSIPIITICAFIVLNIFLSLFDLIFRWLLFIKICLPFPKIGGGSGGGSS
ncbi:MAG: hypothetical protein ACXWUI_06545 [Burkholderiales bacterium]